VNLFSAENNESIVIIAKLNGCNARILLDSGCSEQFLSERFVSNNSIPTRPARYNLRIHGFGGKLLHNAPALVTDEVWFDSGEHSENLKFKVVPTTEQGFYDGVIGMTWLHMRNPTIDWTTGNVWIKEHQLRTRKERRQNAQIQVAAGVSGKTLPEPAGKDEATASGSKTRGTETTREDVAVRPKPKEIYEKELAEVLEKLLKKYHEFIELFVKKEYRLPQHDKCYEAKIPLVEGAENKLKQSQQFRKSPEELRLEQEFVEEFLQAGYIRESDSRCSSRPMFVLKKNGKKRMVIDF
jgi:hypothetical protein